MAYLSFKLGPTDAKAIFRSIHVNEEKLCHINTLIRARSRRLPTIETEMHQLVIKEESIIYILLGLNTKEDPF